MRRLPPLALTYHGVAAVPLRDDPLRLFCAPARVDADIRTLRRWGYELLTFGAWAERVGRGEGEGAAALTFDDGLIGALPDIPLTVFAVSGWLGGRHPETPVMPVATNAELRALRARGAEIGAHTVTHPDLTTLSPEAVEEELTGSRDALEALLQAPVTSLAYPYGAADAAVRAAAAAAGFAAACRTAGNGSFADPHDLPRQAMGPGGTNTGLWLKRTGRHETLMRLPLGRRVRRQVRRFRTRHH